MGKTINVKKRSLARELTISLFILVAVVQGGCFFSSIFNSGYSLLRMYVGMAMLALLSTMLTTSACLTFTDICQATL